MTKERLESFRRLGAAFAAGGERYDRLRPGYPDRVVTWLVEGTPAAGVVVDIGAGTGKLTAALLAHGFAVIAVDPSHDMLAQLSRQLPTVQTQVRTGEAAGLPDHTADLITFAQSWQPNWSTRCSGIRSRTRARSSLTRTQCRLDSPANNRPTQRATARPQLGYRILPLTDR